MGLRSRLSRRRVAVLVTCLAVLTPTTSAFAQNVADVAMKASMADGDKAAAKKDWKTAVTSYDAANKASPNEQSLDSLANAYYQAGDIPGAWLAYNEWNDKYAAKASATKKTIATNRLKELTDKTGGVTITVNVAGALVTVDDKPIGTSPLPSQIRMVAGPHHIKITKDAYIAFDQSPTVATGTMTAVDAKLVSVNAKAKITVTEKGNHQVRVLIDGIDRGPAPFTGDVDPGPHEILVKGNGFTAPAQKVTVAVDAPTQVDFTATQLTAPVRISTDDNRGSISVDGQLVGQGIFQGELGGGTHEIKIAREGYDTLTQTLVIETKDPINKTYSLQLSQNVQTQAIAVDADRPQGIYGGFDLMGFATPGGTGSTIEQQCDSKPGLLRSCDTPGGLGAGLGGYIGYHWDPVGVELYGAGSYDVRKDTENWDSATASTSANPARKEDYTIRRYGGEALVRVRYTKQWQHIRLTFPVGAGVAFRDMSLTREVTATEGAITGAKTIFSGSASKDSYVSPVISLEPTIAYRITPGVAVTLGIKFWLEAAASFLDSNNNPTTKLVQTQKLGPYGISTPPYALAQNAQIFIGPVVGMMFGP